MDYTLYSMQASPFVVSFFQRAIHEQCSDFIGINIIFNDFERTPTFPFASSVDF